jgi:hypothetical protein
MSDLQIILQLGVMLGNPCPCLSPHVVSMGARAIVLDTQADVAPFALVDGAKACRQIIWC